MSHRPKNEMNRVLGGALAVLLLAAVSVLMPGSVPRASAATAPPAKLYWTDANWFGTAVARVSRVNADGTDAQPLVTPGGVNHAFITVTPADGGAVYWADSWNAGTTPSIRRANLDGTDPTTIVSGLYCIFGVAVDPVARKLYWTCTDNRVMRSNLDGTAVETLVTVAGAPLIGSPQGIALDLETRTMYWANTATGRIQRANLDGTMVADVVTGLAYPHDVALDLTARKLYWTAGASVGRANLDGTAPQSVVTGLHNPVGIALDSQAGKLYWTSYDPGRIGHANLDGTSPGTVLASGLDLPWGIAVLTDRPPSAANDALTVDEDGSGVVAVLVNDSDEDGDALSVTGSSDPAHGEASCSAAGACTYQPDHDHNGLDSFAYTVSDGRGGTDIGTISVDVRPQNDAPLALDAEIRVSGSVPGEMLLPAVDVDGDALTFEIAAAPAHGALASLGASRIRYTADEGYVGADSFTFRASDGVIVSNTGTVRVIIDPPPPPPPPLPPPPPPVTPPVFTQPVRRCVVPNVKGKSLPAAKAAVRRAACRVGRVRSTFSKARRGRVVAQSPRAGRRVARGTRVALVVSRGRKR